jgi:hypothetical protein
MMMTRSFFTFAVLALLAQGADAVVVSGTNISLSSGAPVSNYALTTFQSPTSGSTTTWLNVSGGDDLVRWSQSR